LDRLAVLPPDAPALTRLRHDVRTPLNQIIGYCDLWLEGEEEDAAVAAPFGPQLGRLRAAGLGLLTRLDALKAGREQRAAGSEDGVSPALLPAAGCQLPAAEPGRVLVVDDNAFNREVLVRRLERMGHGVAEAVHGRHALDLLGREHFDVVLLDIL